LKTEARSPLWAFLLRDRKLSVEQGEQADVHARRNYIFYTRTTENLLGAAFARYRCFFFLQFLLKGALEDFAAEFFQL
jgi:hypothetical protein